MNRYIIGIGIWSLALAGLVFSLSQKPANTASATSQLSQFLFEQTSHLELNFEDEQSVAIGDPIYLFEDGKENATLVGLIRRVGSKDSTQRGPIRCNFAVAEFFPGTPTFSSDDFVSYHDTPESMGWVVETMLPPEKQKQYVDQLATAFKRNEDELRAALQPIMRQSIKESVSVIREDLKSAMEARNQRMRRIGKRLQVELVQEDLVPLIREEIWPVIQEEVGPIMNEVGHDMWKQVSVWRFGWRYLYDASPLPEKELTRKEFKRFIDEHGLPIIETYSDSFVEAQRRVMRRVAQNERVQNVVEQSITEFVNDPEVRDMFTEIVNEVVVKNPRLHQVWQRNWSSEQARSAIALANARMQPAIEQIGEQLFGNPNEPIPEEFARVLRHRVLNKDDRWMVLNHHPESAPAAQTNKLSVITPPMDGAQAHPFYETPGNNE